MITTTKKIFPALFLISVFSNNSHAQFGIFGPKNYDDCILEGMIGVTSDAAAYAIQGSCSRKFPRDGAARIEKGEPFSQETLDSISIRGGTWLGVFVSIDVHNGSQQCITDLVYLITTWSESNPNSRSSFEIEFAGQQIEPRSVQGLSVRAGEGRGKFNAKLVSAREC